MIPAIKSDQTKFRPIVIIVIDYREAESLNEDLGGTWKGLGAGMMEKLVMRYTLQPDTIKIL